MDATLSDSLRGILGGTAVVFFGNAIGMGSSFVTRILAARHLGSDGYGLIVLGVTLLNISTLLVLVGLPDGLARQLPRTDRGGDLFRTALLLPVGISIAVAGLATVAADPIADLFGGESFEPLLLVFALALPLHVFIEYVTGGFRGIEEAGYRVITKDLLFKGGLVATVAAGTYAGLGTVGIAAAWPGSLAVASLGGAYLLLRRTSLLRRDRGIDGEGLEMTYLLVAFSLPLMVSGASWEIMVHVDNAILGVLLTPRHVGVYDAAYSLATSLLLVLTTFNFLFLPVFSSLDYRDRGAELGDFYRIVAKWMTFISIPLFVLLVVHSRPILGLVYGQGYTAGGGALAIVASGFFLMIVGGNSTYAVMGLGEGRLLLAGNVSALVLNVVLNVTLVPLLGITGAAVASFVSVVWLKLLYGYYLFSVERIHPFSGSLLRAGVGAGGALWLVSAGLSSLAIDRSALLAVNVALMVPYIGFLLLLGGVDREEIELISAIDDDVDANLGRLIGVLERFA